MENLNEADVIRRVLGKEATKSNENRSKWEQADEMASVEYEG